MWVVELNILGCRISRWADKRRHLLAPDPRSLVARDAHVRPVRVA